MSEAAEPDEPDRVPGHPHPRETGRLFGQGAAERAFLAAWEEGRLHHGWLLCGPRGIGKATLAYRIARALIAAGPAGPSPGGRPAKRPPAAVPPSLDAPEDCPVARRIRAQSEPRLAVVRRTVNERGRLRSQIAVEDVRALRRFLSLTAADGGWRVVIVDAADEMNVHAANALLKLLEEPPALTAFLLVTHSPGALLPTIRSRCRRLELRPLGAEDLAAALAQCAAPLDPAEAAAMALLSGGSVGAALSLAAGGVAVYGRLIALMRGGDGVDRAGLVELAEAAAGRGAAALYELVGRLTLTLVGRMARRAALGTADGEAAPGEAELMARVARAPAQAALWAEAASRIAATTRHARAVNLDPGQTIIDTFLDLDATLAKARDAA